MRFIFLLLRLAKGGAFWAAFGGILSGVLSVFLVARIGSLFQHDLYRGPLFIEFALAATAILLLRIFGEYIVTATGQKIIMRLTEHLSTALLEMPFAEFESVGSSPVLTILTRDIDALTDAALTIPSLLAATGVAGTAFGCGLVYAPRLTLIALLVIVLGVFTFKTFEKQALCYLGGAREEHDILMNHFERLIDGAKELRMNQMRKMSLIRDLRTSLERYRRAILGGMLRYTLGSSFGQYFYLLLLAFCASLLASGSMMHGSFRELTGFVIVLLYVRSSIESIVQLQSTIGRGLISWRNIERTGFVIPTTNSTGAYSAPITHVRKFDRIELIGVTYQYGDSSNSFSLGPISLVLQPGAVTFIAGDNGSGKSTLLKIMVGLYEPRGGELRVNGAVVDPLRISYYRSHFAVIFSDYFLAERLAEGPYSRDMKDALAYLKRLRLDSHVKIADGRVSGSRLSSGQRKRLALLHAYVENRPICVFDEWAADQDPEFREYFYRELIPDLRSEGKCVVAVTHDQEFFSLADHLIWLQAGHLNSSGERASTLH